MGASRPVADSQNGAGIRLPASKLVSTCALMVKAAEQCRRALAINPANLRARLYQARIAADEDRPAEAKALLTEIAAAPVGRYDAPEERRVKEEAATLATKLR
jgi:hypothetical protein